MRSWNTLLSLCRQARCVAHHQLYIAVPLLRWMNFGNVLNDCNSLEVVPAWLELSFVLKIMIKLRAKLHVNLPRRTTSHLTCRLCEEFRAAFPICTPTFLPFFRRVAAVVMVSYKRRKSAPPYKDFFAGWGNKDDENISRSGFSRPVISWACTYLWNTAGIFP